MKILTTISIMLILFSCTSSEIISEEPTIKDLPRNSIIIELASGTNGGFQKPSQSVITSQEEFNSTWEKAYSNFMNAEKPPLVDFNVYQVVLVTMGMKKSGGYSIVINQVSNAKDNLIVEVIETSPGKECITTDAITFPFQLVQLKKNKGEVIFNTIEKTIDCKLK